MKNIITIISLILSQSALVAQVPGYLGKRLFVKANVSTMLALSNPSATNSYLLGGQNSSIAKSGTLGFNNVYNVDMGYVLSRRKAVVGNLGYLKTGVYSKAFTPSLSPVRTQGNDEHDLFYNITGLTVGVGIQNFRLSKGAIAPFGNYNSWSLNYYLYSGDILDKRTRYADDIGRHAKLGVDPKMFDLVLGFEWGHNAILFDKVVLSFGYKINLSYQWLSYKLKSDNEFSAILASIGYEGNNQETFEKRVSERMFYHHLFALKLGVGLVY
jgi:hypothetical protein